MLSEPPRCRPVPVRALKGADSPRGLHRGHSPGHRSPQVLEAQGVVGRSRQVGPIRTAYDSSIRITMRDTLGGSVCGALGRAEIALVQFRPRVFVAKRLTNLVDRNESCLAGYQS